MEQQDELILYHDQQQELWDTELIEQGSYFMNCAAQGSQLSTYHLEAAIAYWHTHPEDSDEKWREILREINTVVRTPSFFPEY